MSLLAERDVLSLSKGSRSLCAFLGDCFAVKFEGWIGFGGASVGVSKPVGDVKKFANGDDGILGGDGFLIVDGVVAYFDDQFGFVKYGLTDEGFKGWLMD